MSDAPDHPQPVTDAADGEPMDIHKPKAAHSWREFLTEIGTIICGILIALSLEQGIEWLHGRHQAEQAEHDLAAGLQPNLIHAAEMWAFEPCGMARIKQLADALQRPGSQWTANPAAGQPATDRAIPTVYSSPGRIWTPAAWDSTVASGVLAHMPRERVAEYARAYHELNLARERQPLVGETAVQLSPLAYDRTLTDQDKAHYLDLLGRIQGYQRSMASLSRFLLQDAHDLGIEPDSQALKQRLDEERRYRPGCIREPKLPFPKE